MDNAVYGSTLQPFAGITTFMRQPATRELQDVDVLRVLDYGDVDVVPVDSLHPKRL